MVESILHDKPEKEKVEGNLEIIIGHETETWLKKRKHINMQSGPNLIISSCHRYYLYIVKLNETWL